MFYDKVWSLFVRIRRLRCSSSLLRLFKYPRVKNRTSLDCGKVYNKRLPSKHVNIRNWGAMSQQKEKWYHSLHLIHFPIFPYFNVNCQILQSEMKIFFFSHFRVFKLRHLSLISSFSFTFIRRFFSYFSYRSMKSFSEPSR